MGQWHSVKAKSQNLLKAKKLFILIKQYVKKIEKFKIVDF